VMRRKRSSGVAKRRFDRVYRVTAKWKLIRDILRRDAEIKRCQGFSILLSPPCAYKMNWQKKGGRPASAHGTTALCLLRECREAHLVGRLCARAGPAGVCHAVDKQQKGEDGEGKGREGR
jgi:hypothetical protein